MSLLAVCGLGCSGLAAQIAVRALPAGVSDLGPVAGGQRIQATVYLQPDAARQSALQQFLVDVQTPGSAQYRHWLTAQAFAASYGASPEQVSRVRQFAVSSGLRVEQVSALRMVVSGPAGLLEAAFTPALHTVAEAGKSYVASTAVVAVPATLQSDVLTVGGMTTLPEATPVTLAVDGTPLAPGSLGSMEDLAGTVEANAARVLALQGATCASSYTDAEQQTMQNLLREATAQGITVLAQSGCATGADASFPATLPEVTAVVASAGAPEEGFLADQPRPSWQDAPGLPDDLLRHEPDAVVSDIAAFSTTLEGILATMPASADGSAARLGNINTVLYELAPSPGLFTQADGAAAGTWESGSGLGTLDLKTLAKLFPRGSLSTYLQVTTTPSFATHGAAIQFNAQVKDTSGQGTAAPTGTITFKTDTGSYALGTGTLVANGATSSAVTVSYNQLPANGYNVIATYSGDANYAANTNQTYFTVGPEEGNLTASMPGSVTLGAMIPVTITDTAASGVGAPNVQGYVIPQGIANPPTYSVQLTGTGSSSSGTVNVPATNGGTMTLLIGCTSSDASFTCYNSFDQQVSVAKGTPTATLTAPTIVTGQAASFTVTVVGVSGQAVPSGTVIVFDNGTNIGQGTLDATGKVTITANGLSASVAHTFTATYYGDVNYNQVQANSSSTSPNTSTTVLTVIPNPPVSGQITTLTAAVAHATGTATATGSGIFYMDGAALATVTLDSAGIATYSSTTLSGATAHTFSAVYSGDTNYATSTSNSVATQATTNNTSSTALTVTPNPPVSGAATVLQVVVSFSSTATTHTIPTGTATFYQDGVALGGAVTLNSFGEATYTSTTLSGTTSHVYTAMYSGDSTYQGSTSNAVITQAQSSGTAATTAALTIVPTTPISGQTTVLIGTVNYTQSGSAVPTGTVSFYQDNVLLGTGQLAGGTTATFTSTTLSSTTAHSYYAVYSGDTTYAGSQSAAVTTQAQNNGTATTATLTLVPTAPVSGQTTVLIGSVSYTPSGSTVPTGTMSFYQDNVLLGTGQVVNGTTATLTSTTLSSTTAHNYYVVYSGDTTYAGSQSATVATQAQSGSASTTTALTIAPTIPISGQTTVLIGSIGYTPSGSAVPTGTISFYRDNVLLGTGPVVNGTTATYSSTTLSSTTAHSYYAVYSGDATYTTSQSAAVTTQAQSSTATTTTTISSSASTVAPGGSVTFTATVSAVSGATVPTGTVTFTSSTQGVLGTATLSATGVATLTTTLTTAGAQSVTATYSGDSTFTTSSSAAPAVVTVSANTTPGALTLTVSPTVTTYGSNVTLTSTVSATPTSGTTGPAGTVTWVLTPTAGGAAITYTSALVTTSGTTAAASITIAAPAAGNYMVTATCVGTNFSCTGLTATAALQVQKATTALNLVATPNPPVTGQPEMLTAYITLASGATSACTGVVTFYVNGASVGTGAVSGNQATYILTLPSANNNTLYAVYSGDTNCQQSLSQTLTLSVPPAATTTVVTLNANPVLQGANVVFTVVVSATPTATNPNPGVPTGTVNFYDTFNGIQTPMGSASLVQNGPSSALATFTTTGLKAGLNSVDVQYAGSKNFSPSDAGSTVVNVTDFSLTFAPASGSVTQGQSLTVLGTVTAINNFSGEVVLGCVPPAGSATTCSFDPGILSNGSGVVTMTITTTAPTSAALRLRGVVGGVSLATLLLGLLWPGHRRRTLRTLCLALALTGVLTGAIGCTTTRSLVGDGGGGSGSGGSGAGGGSSTSGTPTGTLQFSITAAGTDGRTSNTHNLKYSVTVQ